MSALSEDLRWRIINAWQKQKLTTKRLAELFGVGVATVTRLKKTYRDTKSVAAKRRRETSWRRTPTANFEGARASC